MTAINRSSNECMQSMLCGAHRWYVTGSRASLPDAKETAFGLSTLKVKNGKVSEVRACVPLIIPSPRSSA